MTKIDIISGFLGAGKTTFIKKMLEEVFANEKVVLVENEYGEVGIDGGFLKDSGIEIKELNSGCICCSLVGDFTRSLAEVIDTYHPDRILIEPSGVGKLSDVLTSVKKIEDTHDAKVNALVTVANAVKATKQMRAFGEFFTNQVENAATIVLSRTQNMTPEKLEKCVKDLQAVNPKAVIITTPWDEISGQQILSAMEDQDTLTAELMEEAKKHMHEHEHHHDHDHDEECGCGHEHDHDHDHDEECGCGHEHHHDHDHDEECGCGHEHHHDHDHDEECGCGHEHHHDHDHDEECGCGHDHHHHDDECGCGHDHHHDADEVFTSWGRETPHKYTREDVESILKTLCDTEDYGVILRAKGMVPAEGGTWIYFDMVPGEYEVRGGEPDYTGRLCVIGTDIDEKGLEQLFHIA